VNLRLEDAVERASLFREHGLEPLKAMAGLHFNQRRSGLAEEIIDGHRVAGLVHGIDGRCKHVVAGADRARGRRKFHRAASLQPMGAIISVSPPSMTFLDWAIREIFFSRRILSV
jgi:hypothetical protein